MCDEERLQVGRIRAGVNGDVPTLWTRARPLGSKRHAIASDICT
jgi:hypothetical protein